MASTHSCITGTKEFCCGDCCKLAGGNLATCYGEKHINSLAKIYSSKSVQEHLKWKEKLIRVEASRAWRRVARSWCRSPSSSRVTVGCHSLLLSTDDKVADPLAGKSLPTWLIVIDIPSLAAACITYNNSYKQKTCGNIVNPAWIFNQVATMKHSYKQKTCAANIISFNFSFCYNHFNIPKSLYGAYVKIKLFFSFSFLIWHSFILYNFFPY